MAVGGPQDVLAQPLLAAQPLAPGGGGQVGKECKCGWVGATCEWVGGVGWGVQDGAGSCASRPWQQHLKELNNNIHPPASAAPSALPPPFPASLGPPCCRPPPSPTKHTETHLAASAVSSTARVVTTTRSTSGQSAQKKPRMAPLPRWTECTKQFPLARSTSSNMTGERCTTSRRLSREGRSAVTGGPSCGGWVGGWVGWRGGTGKGS
jgi:hypothetical protein